MGVRRGTAFFLLVAILCLIAIVIICIRPARVVGVSSDTLSHSLQKAVGGEMSGSCEEREDGDWTCKRVGMRPKGDSSFGPTATYEVDVSGWGCWEGTRVQEKSSLPPRLDGCITIFDLIRYGD